MAYRDASQLVNAIFDHVKSLVDGEIKAEVQQSIDEGGNTAAEILISTYEEWGNAKMLSRRITPGDIVYAFDGREIGNRRFGMWNVAELDEATHSHEGNIKAWTYINWGSGSELQFQKIARGMEGEGFEDSRDIFEDPLADRFKARDHIWPIFEDVVGRDLTNDQYEGPSMSFDDGFVWVPMQGHGARGEGWMLPRRFAIYKYSGYENPEPFRPTHFIERSANIMWMEVYNRLSEIANRRRKERI